MSGPKRAGTIVSRYLATKELLSAPSSLVRRKNSVTRWPRAMACKDLQLLGQLRHRVEQIGDKAIVRDLEDRRFLVLVDRDNHLGVLHAGEVLDRARDADRDVEVRGHDLAGLTDLPIVRGVATVDCGTGRANGGAELVGTAFDQGELLFAAHTAPAGHDDTGRCQFGAVAGRDLVCDPGRQLRVSGGVDHLDRGRPARGGGVKGGGAEGHDLYAVR